MYVLFVVQLYWCMCFVFVSITCFVVLWCVVSSYVCLVRYVFYSVYCGVSISFVFTIGVVLLLCVIVLSVYVDVCMFIYIYVYIICVICVYHMCLLYCVVCLIDLFVCFCVVLLYLIVDTCIPVSQTNNAWKSFIEVRFQLTGTFLVTICFCASV